MGTFRGRDESLESMWSSIMPKNIAVESQSPDEEIMKLSLLLKSVLNLFSGLREKQVSASTQLERVTLELTSVIENRKQSEAEADTLREDVSLLKLKLQSAEDKAKKFQKEAEKVGFKYERLQSKVSTEVESRLHAMFQNCLKQNKVTTVQEMMTQMYAETQMPEPGAEQSALENTTPKQPVNYLAKKNGDVSSPDVIQPTPPQCNTNGNHGGNSTLDSKKGRVETAKCKLTAIVRNSTPSPDMIENTPTFKEKFRKKDNSKRHKILQLFSTDTQEVEIGQKSEKKPHVYEEETQEAACRSALTENITVPPTLPDSYDIAENTIYVFDQKGKENGILSSEFRDTTSRKEKKTVRLSSVNIVLSPEIDPGRLSPEFKNTSLRKEKRSSVLSPSVADNPTRKTIDSSMSAECVSTPLKTRESRERSPILGNSSSKKNNSRSFKLSAPTYNSKKSLESDKTGYSSKKNSLFQIPDGCEDDFNFSYRMTANNKTKKSIQPSIEYSFNRSKLSLSSKSNNNKKDISKGPGFNGGQRSGRDASLDIIHLSEMEQVEMAIEKSLHENPHESALEDSDATLFIPTDSPMSKKKDDVPKDLLDVESVKNCKQPVQQIIQTQALGASLDVMFEPMFASTAKENYSPKRKSPVSSNFKKPQFTSTEKEEMNNSALEMLAQHLEEEENFEHSDDSALPDSSYDRLPKRNSSPNYAYQGPTVRKKADRKALPGMECTQCGEYFARAFGDDLDQDEKRLIVDQCSRHRGKQPRVRSPENYWKVRLPSTQYMRERQEQPTQ